MKLARLQNQFIDAIYNQKPEILALIKNGKAPKEELLDIYQNNLYSTLTNALRITYARVYQFVGEKNFKKFCQEFIKENRSRSGNLDDYGQNFADFLARKNENFLSDLAKLEWFKQQSYLAKDLPEFDLEELQKLPTEKLFDVKFQLHSSCFLLGSNYNLLGQKKQIKPLKKPNYFVIYRHNFEVKAEKISGAEFNFLNGIKENLSLYQIYEKHQINIQLCLQKYLSNGVIASFLA